MSHKSTLQVSASTVYATVRVRPDLPHSSEEGEFSDSVLVTMDLAGALSLFRAIRARQTLRVIQPIVEARPHLVRERPSHDVTVGPALGGGGRCEPFPSAR
jgi:hypothetical protein